VRVVDGGQHIEMTNTTAEPVVLLGYSGEPYLLVDRLGVSQNARSPSLYLNRSATPGLVYMPPGTDAHAPPVWQRVCDCDTARWHDHRIHWAGSSPPPVVSAAPGRYHLIDTWSIFARQGARTITVTGTLAWVPGPSPVPWLAAAAVVALAIVPIGFLRRWRLPLAAVVLLLVATDVARAAGMVGGRSGGLATKLQGVPDDGVFMLIVWVGAIVIAVMALRGRVGAVFGTATSGLVLALTSGIPTLGVLWHSQVVTAYPPDLQRLLVALTLGVGVGLLPAGWLLIRRIDPVSDPDGSSATAEPVAVGAGADGPELDRSDG
jgi:hypothetical protein